MFDRERLCLNPDCRKPFDPVNPNADCCGRSCRNRKNYLLRLANRFPLLKGNKRLIWSYAIIRSQIDRRKLKQSREELEQLGVVFHAMPPAVKFCEGDNRSTYVLGDIGLVLLDNSNFLLIKRKI